MRKSECGSRKLEVGSRNAEVGSRNAELKTIIYLTRINRENGHKHTKTQSKTLVNIHLCVLVAKMFCHKMHNPAFSGTNYLINQSTIQLDLK